jgi:hypothetical protein
MSARSADRTSFSLPEIMCLGEGFDGEVPDASRPPADEAIVAGGLHSQQLPFWRFARPQVTLGRFGSASGASLAVFLRDVSYVAQTRLG